MKRLVLSALSLLGGLASACGTEATSSGSASQERRPSSVDACGLVVKAMRRAEDAEGRATMELFRFYVTSNATEHARNRRHCADWAREEPGERWCIEPRSRGAHTGRCL